jgi:hypothetical protein
MPSSLHRICRSLYFIERSSAFIFACIAFSFLEAGAGGGDKVGAGGGDKAGGGGGGDKAGAGAGPPVVLSDFGVVGAGAGLDPPMIAEGDEALLFLSGLGGSGPSG